MIVDLYLGNYMKTLVLSLCGDKQMRLLMSQYRRLTTLSASFQILVMPPNCIEHILSNEMLQVLPLQRKKSVSELISINSSK